VNKKLILRICFLAVALIGIFVVKNKLSKPNALDMNEISKQVASFQWCSEFQGTVKWKDPALRAKYKRWTDHALRKKFCNVDLEPLSEAEMTNAKWQDLALAKDSQASFVKLEWDKALGVFRAAGLPFKSKKLSRELLDDSH
jgi:hypothetical protein